MSETDEWAKWIEEAVSKNHIKHYEYEHFSNIQEIGVGGFGKVYRANYRRSDQYLVLKSLFNLDNSSFKELVNELELQREVNYDNNIINFYGITINQENQDKNFRKYLLVMEYADGGSLKRYLKDNFKDLDWTDKCKLAYQLSSAVACLHDEGIVHRDLHSNNVLVHQGNIKLADFGLSKKVSEVSKTQKDIFGVIPYIDPKKFGSRSYSLNKKSDVYSIGVLLWELTKGQPPFYVGEAYEGSLAIQILQGVREDVVPGTPADYVKLYSECWDGDPDKRPSIHEVVERLKSMVSQSGTTSYQQQVESEMPSKNIIMNSAENYASHGDLSQIIQSFDKLSMESMTSASSKQIISQSIPENELSLNAVESAMSSSDIDLPQNADVEEIVKFIFEATNRINEVNEKAFRKQHVLDFFKSSNINSQEIYNWLSDNQNSSLNSIFLLGYFNYYGIETDENLDRAFNLFFKASKQNHMLARYFVGKCYQHGYGTPKNETLAFRYFEKLANENYAIGQLEVGYCYNIGLGVKEDSKKAIYWYEKASDSGNVAATYKLGQKYINGMGVNKNFEKAFELFQKSAEKGYLDGMAMLGACYHGGIGTNVDWKKAFECYEKAATSGNRIAQYNLANLYKDGEGTEKNIEKAIYWFKISAEQGYENAGRQLKKLLK